MFVCENPSVVAAAADRLGARARPLVCTEGQPKTALRLLLGQLRAAGAEVAYHGDLDWAGLQIANGMAERFGAKPWRLHAHDYRAAVERSESGVPSSGPEVPAVWDPALAATMRAHGRAIHEEAVIDELVGDLEG